jgi:hypothetical protein
MLAYIILMLLCVSIALNVSFGRSAERFFRDATYIWCKDKKNAVLKHKSYQKLNDWFFMASAVLLLLFVLSLLY